MKKLLALIFLSVSPIALSQTYIKLNAPTTLVGIPQVGVETSIGKNFTFQGDVLGSYWESVNGGPFKTLMAFAEIRYNFKENFKGFYVGGHIGGAIFELQKWSYLDTNLYQKGEAYFMGATIGYKFKFSDKWMMDVFVGAGNQQAHYTGHFIDTDYRYEASRYNKSGEWLPYRGGIMLSYKL